jgi:hypothetical protein
MALFKGKNNIKSSSKLLFERAKYKNYMNNNQEAAIKDLSLGEFNQFGRIDPSMNTVYCNGASLKTLDGVDNGESHLAIDFVADAFNAIKRNVKDGILKGAIPKNVEYISDMKPYISYQNPLAIYDAYITRMFDSYNNIFLQEHRINSFHEYYNLFLEFAERMGYNYPMTFSGFQRSKHSNIFTTGLAISIADFSIDNDEDKEKFFIDSPVFTYLKSVCLNNGMVLMENAPYVMVADILSPSLLLYTKEYYLSSKNSIFLKHFNYCINRDIELLFNNILINYRKYYNRNKFYNNIGLCKEGNIVIEKVYIQTVNNNIIKNKYTESYIYDMFIKLKNIEEYHHFDDSEIRKIIKKAQMLQKTLDNSEAVSYIRKEFRRVYKFRHGGLNYLDQRATKRRNNDISDT